MKTLPRLWVMALVGGMMLALLGRKGFAAETIPATPKMHFNDIAGLMKDPATGPNMEVELTDFERNTSIQIVVAIYSTMQSDSDIDDYTTRVAQAWHVGQKGKNSGVVVFVFVDSHDVSIKPGYGLEGALPDATCKEMIDHDIVPAFRAGNFDGGMKNLVQSIQLAVQGEYVLPSSVHVEKQSQWGNWASCFCLLMIPALFIFFWLLPKPAGVQYSSGGGSSSGWWLALGLLTSLASGGGGYSGGGGGGFTPGGGSFGGGGASGKW